MSDTTRIDDSELDPEATRLEGDTRPPGPAPRGLAGPRPPGALVGGRYRLERVLNAGGMGTVYLAQPVSGSQKVVVKFPHAHLLESPEFLERFEQEVAALQKLAHPHIVEIYDAGRDRSERSGSSEELPYLVVRHMSGGSLRERIQQAGGRLSVDDLGWLPPIADALDFIHAQRIVHRDVKPDNLLFDIHGTAYLSDFGIAKLLGHAPSLTGQGSLGSPAYMAPEFAQRLYTPRFDQYSLAVVVYQALSGGLPHGGESGSALLASKLVRAPESLAKLAPELPAPLVAAVMRGLAADPQERFESCAAFSQAVLQAAERPRSGSRVRRAALLALAAAAAGAVYVCVPRSAVTPSAAREIALLGQELSKLAAERVAAAGTADELRRAVDDSAARIAEHAARVDRLAPLQADLGGLGEQAGTPAERDRQRARIAQLGTQARGRLAETEQLLEQSDGLAARAADLRRRARAADASDQHVLDIGLQVARAHDQPGAAGLADVDSRLAALKDWALARGASLRSLESDLGRQEQTLAALRARIEGARSDVQTEQAQLAALGRGLRAVRDPAPAPVQVPLPAAPPPSLRDQAAALAAQKLVAIPAGPFEFGCDAEQDPACEGTPQRTVSLPDFAIDRSEVSMAEYRRCVDAGACTAPAGLAGAACNWSLPDRASHPVNCVYFNQASVYCNWIGETLPTEEQWEKAARGTHGAPFPWGSAEPSCELARYGPCARSETRPIESGSAAQNANGLFDMAGNVWEWTSTSDTDVRQVVRGGSFRNNAKGVRADRRTSIGRTESPDGAGFRCAKDGAPAAP